MEIALLFSLLSFLRLSPFFSLFLYLHGCFFDLPFVIVGSVNGHPGYFGFHHDPESPELLEDESFCESSSSYDYVFSDGLSPSSSRSQE